MNAEIKNSLTNILLRKIIEKTKPPVLKGWRAEYKRIFIGGDLFYEGEDLLRPITPAEVVLLLTENQKMELLKIE